MNQIHSKDNTTQTFSLRRPDLRMVMGLLTGHCTLRKHKYRMGIITGNPKSRLCRPAEETAWHAICEYGSLSSDNINSLILLNWGRIFHQKDLVNKLLRLVKDSGSSVDPDFCVRQAQRAYNS